MRIIRTLLGNDAIADSKVEWGTALTILGVEINMNADGFAYKPSRDKVIRWLATLRSAVEQKKLHRGDAMKLAGKLAWGVSKLFRKFGRAMLRPIFDQQTNYKSDMGFELERCLRWWIGILENQLAEFRLWEQPKVHWVHLFCDARGEPPHLGAVLITHDKCLWTHYQPTPEIVQHFRSRKDNQIMGMELLSIVLGIHSFSTDIMGMPVVIHSDNAGSEVLCIVHVTFASHIIYFSLRSGVAVRARGIMRRLCTKFGKIS